MENKLLNLLSVHNAHNINSPYATYFKVIKKQSTGKGFKRTHAYISLIDEESLEE